MNECSRRCRCDCPPPPATYRNPRRRQSRASSVAWSEDINAGGTFGAGGNCARRTPPPSPHRTSRRRRWSRSPGGSYGSSSHLLLAALASLVFYEGGRPFFSCGGGGGRRRFVLGGYRVAAAGAVPVDAVDNSGSSAETSDSGKGGDRNVNGGEGASDRSWSSSQKIPPSSTASSADIDPTLDESSVVVITGAAGFLGSELAVALRRTYGVRKLLLVDDLGVESENESTYVPSRKSGGDGGGTPDGFGEPRSEYALSAFEFKRQRAFRVLQELTAPPLESDEIDGSGGSGNGSGAESIRFYRADMRPAIPEFFDFGEVPLLEGIFRSHPDVTHVVHLADAPASVNQAVPRARDSIKAGRFEGLLEEFRLAKANGEASGDKSENSPPFRLPHLVFASSSEIYDHIGTAEEAEETAAAASEAETGGSRRAPHPNPPPFREDRPITVPSTLRGAAKLIDEVLASAFHSTDGIYSVGLRFFPVYGPWSAPGSEVFDLVDRLADRMDVKGDGDSGSDAAAAAARGSEYERDVRDYVYIDDAVDAIMAAMQYRPPAREGENPHPVVFNVGTGVGTSLEEVRLLLEDHFPGGGGGKERSGNVGDPGSSYAERLPTASYASTARAEALLGFRARVPLREGLAHTLVWHLERAFPFGRSPSHPEPSPERRSTDATVRRSLDEARRGSDDGGDGDESSFHAGGCSPLDRECLRDAPVFPCASECGKPDLCTPSAWDDVAKLSVAVTSGCDAVLYTVLLELDAEQIPSATAAVSVGSLPHVGAGLSIDATGERTRARCNIAFVAEGSPLVRRLRSEGEEYVEEGVKDGESGSLPPLLRHGFWTVLPVETPSSSDPSSSTAAGNAWIHAFSGTFALEYLPKISPGRFFGSSVRYAVYADPDVLFDNLPDLLQRMEEGPPAKDGFTALMISSRRRRRRGGGAAEGTGPGCDAPNDRRRFGGGSSSSCPGSALARTRNDAVQWSAYNMVRIALRGEIIGGGATPVLDSSFVVHALGGVEDARLFRCDAYGETAIWGASSDVPSIEFIVSLHDMWSRAVAHWSGKSVWWSGVGASSPGSTPSSAAAMGAQADGDGNGDNRKSEGNEGVGGDSDAKSEASRRLSESAGEATADGGKQRGRGVWMGVLSSTNVQFFTNIVPASAVGAIHLDDYPHQ